MIRVFWRGSNLGHGIGKLGDQFLPSTDFTLRFTQGTCFFFQWVMLRKGYGGYGGKAMVAMVERLWWLWWKGYGGYGVKAMVAMVERL